MSFETLHIRPELVKALKEIGIVKPTTIQEHTIKPILDGKDVVGISKTGSGKTAAFGVPLLQNIEKGKGTQALVVCPTRELAVQIAGELKKFSKYLGIKFATIYGGVSYNPQIEAMKKAEVVIGTPGRLRDHLSSNVLDLSKLRCFVLDEADKMVEMGFIDDIKAILEPCPKDRQILLFGATISTEIAYLRDHYMHNPQEIKGDTKVEYLEQYYYDIPQNEKFSLLMHLLKKEDVRRAIIFCSARSTVELVEKNLKDNGIKASMIHGKLSQNRRLKIMENFNKGRPNILVASSVAARGLHIDDVSHVFNYDLSQDPQEYVHRVGRTARAGASGKAITLLGNRDQDIFGQILDRYPLDVLKLPREQFAKIRFNARTQSRGRKQFHSHTGHHKGPHRRDSYKPPRFAR